MSPYSYAGNSPIIAVDVDGRDVLIRVYGEVARVVTEATYSEGVWNGGKKLAETQQFAAYRMVAEDYGDQSLRSLEHGIPSLVVGDPKVTEFEVARDAWYSAEDHSGSRFGENQETPPLFGQVTDRTEEHQPTEGNLNGWLGVNEIGRVGGTIRSGPTTFQYGISIHPGDPSGSIGCLTMTEAQFNHLRKIVLRAIKNGQTVYILINGRKARYSEERRRWEYVDENDEQGVE